jgi:predicted Rdx family selenoprotein
VVLGTAAEAVAATTTVPPGADLQTALNAARPGDVLVLQAGARYVGSFKLPPNEGLPITIRSSAALPERRIGPQDIALLPILAAPEATAVIDGVGASNWRLDGIAFEPVMDGSGEVILLQDSTKIYMDRLLIVGGVNGQKRGIRGNGQDITLTRSYIANIARSSQDSQAFCAWDGAGPYTLTNNYLEAASENVMFGGADSRSADRVPSDILVEGNHFSKRLEWRGAGLVVKNLFELKSARRITIRGNLFERNWTDAQTGFGILLKVVNQGGTAPWSVLEDVVFEQNIVRDTENGFNILGSDYAKPAGHATRITIRNNLLLTPGVAFQLGGEIGDLAIDHNTIEQGYTLMSLYKGTVWSAGAAAARPGVYAVEHLTYTNNLARHNAYGVKGQGTAVGTPSLTAHTVGFAWTNNVLAGGAGMPYPSITWFPSVAAYVQWFDSNYHLVAGSPYLSAATDGEDVGVEWGLSVGASGSSPFGGTTPMLPASAVQFEDFDAGGSGIAYGDASPGNAGGGYRTTDVDIEATTDGGAGYDVGWAFAGEWLNYTVNVTTAGTYDLDVRVASAGAGGTFHIEVDGVDKTGRLTVPNTRGWQTWITIRKSGITLTAGPQVWRVVMDTNGATRAGGNFNYFKIAASTPGAPYGGAPALLPGTIQVENFDDGGAGHGYADTTAGNAGGKYRTTDVDIQSTSDGGSGNNVGWVLAGEWLNYSVDVTSAGNYDLDVRVASAGAGGTFHIEVNGVDKTGRLTVPNTGGWQTWTTIRCPAVALSSGPQVWRIVMDSNGSTAAVGNFNYIVVSGPK